MFNYIPMDVDRALVNALRDHPQDVGVQYGALMALVDVSVNDGNRAYVVKEDAHTEVVASMRRHLDSWMVQAAGCCQWVIGNSDLADNKVPVDQLELGLKEAHVAIVNGTKAHRDNPEVVHQATWALGNMVGSANNQMLIAEGGGVVTTLEVMAEHVTSEQVAINRCQVYRRAKRRRREEE